MSSSKRLGRGLRDQLRIHQIFAEEHYWYRRRAGNRLRGQGPSVCKDPVPNPPRQVQLHCPLCALKKSVDQMSVDHAPPDAGQSHLGPAVAAVLTCKECNNGRGSEYEETAAAVMRGEVAEVLTPEELAKLAELRTQIEQIVAVQLHLRPLAVQLTDLKAAFLLAFATLGYRWALDDAVRPVRQALKAGHEPDMRHATGFSVAPDSSMFGSNVVLEVGGPHPCVMVIASTGAGVVMPLPGTPIVPAIASVNRIRARSYPWPETAAHAKVNEVDRAYRLGTLFHADLCHTHEWPTPHATA